MNTTGHKTPTVSEPAQAFNMAEDLFRGALDELLLARRDGDPQTVAALTVEANRLSDLADQAWVALCDFNEANRTNGGA